MAVDQASQIRDFVLRRFRSPKLAALDRDMPLFSSGIVDSFGVLELIAFLEDTFGIVIDTTKHELLEFDTLNKIEAVVAREREGA
jgi:acyl carrier protein